MLSKSEIAKAVEAIRSLSDIIERLEKATWPESQSDVLRKADLVEANADPSAAALAALADLTRRVADLHAADAKRYADEAVRKTWSVS
jgi:hypothetical protein